MTYRRKIRGSGGGGGAEPPRQPVVSPDSLQSNAYLRLVDAISEGEIEGIVGGLKGVFLDETPIENPDGSKNFSINDDGFQFETRNGTQVQSYIPGFNSVENEIQVGVEVKNVQSVTRQITNSNVDRVRLRIVIPNLSNTDINTGDVGPASVTLQFQIQPNGGSFTTVGTRTVSGKASSQYEFSYTIELTGSPPWNIRVIRTTGDSPSQYLQNRSVLASMTEVIDAKLRYPNTAVTALRISAREFGSVPRRAYRVRGIKIKIPSNATVRDDGSLEYTGIWDGTFVTAWSSNPAWVFYDLLSSSRYGLGDFVPEDQIDKWALYEIGRYCDELVPSGLGDASLEPRFSCNLAITDRGEAYQVIQALASTFRSMIYWASGAITVSQDKPQDAVALFAPANVAEGVFQYVGASSKVRHTVAIVLWNDPDDFYRQKAEYVEDQAGVAKFGVQTIQVTAFGCSSRGQAHRLGKWILFTEQYESETVSFRTGLEGIVARPGDIIKIADPTRAGARMGGRIAASTTTTVTVDADIGAASGNTISVMIPDGTVEERTVIDQVGRVLTVETPFSEAPTPSGVWILKSPEIEPQNFRILSIKEESDGFVVTALKHVPDKYDFIENNIALEDRSYSDISAAPGTPKNIKVTESLYQTGSEVKSKATVSWDRAELAVSYYVRYRKGEGNWIEAGETSVNDFDVLDTQPDTYTFQVYAINAIGKRSGYAEASTEILGKTAPPSNVTNFSMIPNAGQAYLTWDLAPDLDVRVGGKIRIRHTPRTTGQLWRDGIDIIPAVSGFQTNALAPLLSGTYMAKFEDSSGNFSESEALIVTTVPYGIALNVVSTQTEHPTFPGAKTNMSLDVAENALTLDSGVLIDDYGLIDEIGSFDYPGGFVDVGVYEFENTVDLGGVWPFRVYSTIDLEAYYVGSYIDSRTDLIDDWVDVDGDIVNDVDARLYMRTTEDNPGGSPVWTPWKWINAGSYVARGIQFKLEATSGDETHNIYVRELEVTIDMEDRSLSLGPLTSGTGSTYRVNYSEPFYAAPSVQITANAMSSGDFYTITNDDENGFDIVFKNSSSVTVSRNFYVLAKGYGRKIA